MQIWQTSDLVAAAAREGGAWSEFLRVPELSAGLYRLPAGGDDRQEPHTEDELYYVISGRAAFRAGSDDREVGPGSAIFVPAGQEHRFHGIREDLVVLVVFGPAEYTKAAPGDPSALPERSA